MPVRTNPSPIPGFVHRDTWAAEQGKCSRTGKRWQDAGLIVVCYLGKEPYVDIEATAARMRGKDKPRRQRAQGGWSPRDRKRQPSPDAA